MSYGEREPTSIIDFRSINRALQNVQAGLDQDFAALKQAISELPDDPDREDIVDWFLKIDPSARETVSKHLINEKKRYVLKNEIGDSRSYMEGIGSKNTAEIAQRLSLSEISYYESFFRFAERTSTLHQITELSGLFRKIAQESETAEDAESRFVEFVESSDSISNLYADSAGDLPSPIIGEVGYEPKPRVIHFPDSDHIYMEFWKTGEKVTKFDVSKSDYVTIQTRSRIALRIHLDSETIEYASPEDNTDQRDRLLDSVLTNFSTPNEPAQTDGGVALVEDLHESVNLNHEDINQVNNNLGVMSTLDSFRGRSANAKLRSVDDQATSEDDLYEQLKRRGYLKSHPQILFGVQDEQYEPIDPKQVHDYSIDPDDLPQLDELVSEIKSNSEYDDVKKFTVVMNSDDDSIRIWKSNIYPRVRRKIIHRVIEELGI